MNPDQLRPNKDWILEVLSDIREFAQENDLPVLAKQLNAVATIAESEISSESAPPNLVRSQE